MLGLDGDGKFLIKMLSVGIRLTTIDASFYSITNELKYVFNRGNKTCPLSHCLQYHTACIFGQEQHRQFCQPWDGTITQTDLDLGADQIKPCDAGANQVETSDVGGKDVFRSGRKCVSAFHNASVFGVFFSELPDKGHGTAPPDIGQQTALRRPVKIPKFLNLIYLSC